MPLDLLGRVRIERVQGLQLVLGDVRSEPQRQGIVPAIDAEHRASRHVGGQPLGGLDTAVRSPVDAGDEGHAPQCGEHCQRPAADKAGRTGPASGAEQRGEPDAGEHRQGGIDGQQIAHGRRPARGDDHEPAADPDRQQQQLSGAPAPADHRADQRSNGQCRSQGPTAPVVASGTRAGPCRPIGSKGGHQHLPADRAIDAGRRATADSAPTHRRRTGSPRGTRPRRAPRRRGSPRRPGRPSRQQLAPAPGRRRPYDQEHHRRCNRHAVAAPVSALGRQQPRTPPCWTWSSAARTVVVTNIVAKESAPRKLACWIGSTARAYAPAPQQRHLPPRDHRTESA